MKKLNKSTLSVIMPAYNSESYIEQAILSVLNQTYKDFEFIIIDDNSTDSTLKIINKFARKDSRIRVLQSGRNLNCGGDKCANLGLKAAQGEYIARMDADDISYPTRFEKQIKFLEDNKNIFLIGSNADVINHEGEIIGEKTEPLSSEAIYKAYFGFHPLVHPTCMFRSKLKNGKRFEYKIKYSANNDYYTFFRLICQGYKFVNMDERLIKYRIHSHNATFVHMKHKFVNSLKIRLSIVHNYGYRPSFKDVVMLCAQTMTVMLLPERVLLKIYFLAKGIISKEDILSSFRPALFRKSLSI